MALKSRLLLLGILFLTGCAWPRISTYDYSKLPGSDIIVTAAHNTDWLVIIGAVTIAFGVATLLNGNTKAVGIIAAGITILAVSLLITTYLSLLAAYHTYFIMAIIALGVISFFVFAHTAADFNKDGKIDCQDIRYLLAKLFFKTTPLNVITKTASPAG
jgi:hypothetical protein